MYYCDGFWHIHQHESATWIHVSRYPEHNSNLPCYPMASGFFHSTRVGCIFNALHLHWSSLLYMVMYLFQCYFLKSSHPWTLPLSLRVCSLYVDLFLLAFMQNHCYCLPKSHLYALVNNICLSHSNFFFFTLNNRLQVELPHSKWHKYMFFCT